MKNKYIQWFEDTNKEDTAIVGGKNASLGEMIKSLAEKDVRVPDGFATTVEAYTRYLKSNNIDDTLKKLLAKLRNDEQSIEQTGKAVRKLFLDGEFPDDIASAIKEAYGELSQRYDSPARDSHGDVDVAVRSSATAEDLPEASFAGQQETFLNISGDKDLLDACRKCFASLFTDRAISYREERQFGHDKIALSVGVQKMVRSDKAGSGVMFSIDTESGFPDVVLIDAVWGLGENVVQGTVNPDGYRVFKPLLQNRDTSPIIEKRLGEKEKTMVYARGGSATVKNKNTPRRKREQFVLTDEEIVQLARWACVIEDHYDKPMDMEWAKDGDSGELYIVQARPETVQSQKQSGSFTRYHLRDRGEVLVKGLAIGDAIASGKAKVLHDIDESDQFEDGGILVTEMTDPDWGPIMKRAAAIVTEHGGRTSHAAIVSRELGIPAVVGAEKAMAALDGAKIVTVSCAEGDTGKVYEGELEYEEEEIDLGALPTTSTQIMINIASPEAAMRWWRLPVHGIGLARMEFIINNIIKIHPMALIHPEKVEDKKVRKSIDTLTKGYPDKEEYFVDHLSRGIARIAASQYPDPVIVRMSDFKTNEYANLIGGSFFEPHEENPMLGFRGASRYYSDRYRAGFGLECAAIDRARRRLGFENIVVMIPFCRTPEEADKVLEVMESNGLERGRDGLEIYVMCEIPSNVVLAEQFGRRFDGFSIGSNDLTQLMLGVDRDLAELSELFDERNEAVKIVIGNLIEVAHKNGKKVGICGQAPSDYPDFAEFLVNAGIDSISLNPDSVIRVMRYLAEAEGKEAAPGKS
ncbi:phosphoenolpyruvate synthase [Desulfopila inferna]|uniref:phosphoenolpyruvate synthase n=1 Tax=Desulfopila inferna TaxID=468528 RepID=UPI0019667332|nr:phosphoenolpyruvate synthase [Desulfopila inferna]MBM9606485.1 phosphoenolpyruvate synthase [Desulfopila inferna]